jgi:hypothetical protein
VTIAILKASLYALIGAFLIVVGFWIKARLEERFLSQELGPETYAAYRRRVPMLIPFLPLDSLVTPWFSLPLGGDRKHPNLTFQNFHRVTPSCL